MKLSYLALAIALAVAACSPPASTTLPTEPNARGEAATNAPAEALAAIEARLPGFSVVYAASNNSTGAQGYNVSGTSGGSNYDVFVILGNEGWNVATIDREIAWADAPSAVRTAAGAVTPARVVESRQADGAITIYQLFAAAGAEPTMEIRLQDGEAAVMPPAH